MAIVDGKIRCSDCHEWRAVAAFPPSSVKRGNGVCAACNAAASAERRRDPALREQINANFRRWYKKNSAKHLARTQRYYRANPDRSFDSHLRRTYGISFRDYERLLASQGGCCAICRKPQNTEKLRLAVDHDHATGRVRGLLCHACNKAIGIFGDTADGIRRVLAYLERAQQSPVRATPAIRINLLQGVN